MLLDKTARNTSFEFTVKTFTREKDGRGAHLAVIDNHAGDMQCQSIYAKQMNFLQSIKLMVAPTP